VILDATWADAEWREEAWRLAKLADSDLIQLRCELPVQVAAARARQRQGDPSDAGAEIAVALAGDFAPWPDALAIDTSGTPKDALDGAVRAMSGSEPSVLLT
jgi:hypothetical protein